MDKQIPIEYTWVVEIKDFSKRVCPNIELDL